MKKVLLFVLALSLFVSFTSVNMRAHADEHELKYDTSGRVVVDEDIKRTYDIPPISGGFLYENTEGTVKPVLSMKIIEDSDFCINDFNCKLGVTIGKDYAGISTHLLITEIYEISAGPSFGYNTKTEETSVGVSFLMVEF